MNATLDRTIRIPVSLGPRSYNIVIAAGAVSAGDDLRAALASGRALLVTTESLCAAYAQPLLTSLRASDIDCALCVLADGEQHKTMETALTIIEASLKAGLDRKSALIALGGGVVGDVTGFAAAIFMRGIDLIQVPTTLLAQVDASVGGKVAVNHPRAKNLLGAFHQPRLVLIDPLTLGTLPARELRSGLAEVVKYGVIADEHLFSYVEENLDSLLARDVEPLTHIIRRSCEIKSELVSRDERDTGDRALLNYGHTVGHALEALDYGRLAHGEAVSVGMSVAARVARTLGMAPEALVGRQEAVLVRAGLPVRWQGGSVEAILDGMRLDKKTESGQLRMVLPTRIGAARVVAGVPPAVVRAALEEVAQ